MENTLPQAVLEKILEEINGLMKYYTRTTEELKHSYERTPEIRKAFLEAGIEYTKVSETEHPEEKIIGTYTKYKELLEERVGLSKELLENVNGLLSSVDQQLLLLDSPYDPKFGIQTQNPRIFKTNKSNAERTEEEQEIKQTHCVCGRSPYGTMIACDAYHMESPWFHMDCVDCVGTPKGHWLCPKCRPAES